MCGPRRELDGDPEAMRRFASQVLAIRLPEASADAGDHPCPGGMRGCANFVAVESVATTALARFLAETDEALDALKAAAALSAMDYLETDRSGTADILDALHGAGEQES
ncbi:hypothetical protein SAMN05216266_10916 [Amycolatopsis marina]|uniref:Excreted virulence factor EspC, type VII ESX diderm n=1 Tax=Amycolatopsis marina TaxID=490629 RepID=A0A1I1AH90_9PSEU|nr:hypothetical protein [Amycolatopsis marina]SFB35860.1 hypothetical protein SAMN05216266_10916 [Amycolatopsis marina]